MYMIPATINIEDSVLASTNKELTLGILSHSCYIIMIAIERPKVLQLSIRHLTAILHVAEINTLAHTLEKANIIFVIDTRPITIII